MKKDRLQSLVPGILLLLLSSLLTACKHSEPQVEKPGPELRLAISATELRQHLVGSWWYYYYTENPSAIITFTPDRRWSLQKTNNPTGQTTEGYWHTDINGRLFITKEKDAPPESNLDVFMPRQVTDTQMIFGHPSTGDRIVFKKVTP